MFLTFLVNKLNARSREIVRTGVDYTESNSDQTPSLFNEQCSWLKITEIRFEKADFILIFSE